MFCLQNLVSKAVEPCVPWTWTNQAPDHVRGKEGKKARDKWINDPKTIWQVYNAVEGVIPNQRVAKGNALDDEGNPPLKIHALIGDYDAPVTDEELQTGLERLGENLPNYFERTLSGNVRLVWLFEQPVAVPNRKFAEEFLQLAMRELRLESVAVALDKPAFVDVGRYYTNSGNWLTVDADRRLPAALTNGWVVEVSSKHVWRKDRGSVEIPLPVVAAELGKKFPSFPGCWPGDFTEGSQGPTFWVEGSESPKSAVVKPTGLFTFSSHATKPFYAWSDLLGAQFVEKYKTELMGKAVEGIYHDGTKYWRKDGYGDWKWYTKEDIASHLNVDRGLSTVKDGGLPSEVARAIQYVQNWQAIAGAAPFVFQSPGLLIRSGNKFLNTHTRKVLTPARERAVWGPGGTFPFLSNYLEVMFETREQLEYFIAWLSRTYRGAYYCQMESGHAVFLLGVQGSGKTLLSQGLLPLLLGGGADAESYLLGKTDFNSDLFDVGLWTVDDNSANVSSETHKKFSAMVKKMAANTVFSYHAKFRVPCSVEWLGRVVVTANDDEASAAIVPDLSISILDKLMLFRANKDRKVAFPNRQEMLRLLAAETPAFARYLLDHEVPAHLLGDARFGIKAFHHPDLLRVADQSSTDASFSEILEDWSTSYFSEHPDVPSWTGSAYQFLKELHRDPLRSEAGLRGLSPLQVGKRLAALKARNHPQLHSDGSGSTRTWVISRPPASSPKPASLPQGKKFSK